VLISIMHGTNDQCLKDFSLENPKKRDNVLKGGSWRRTVLK